MDNWLLYDGECPFCTRYVRYARFRESAGPVRLVDARGGGPEAALARARGLDLDEGMVLSLDGQLYHGGDALNVMALLSTKSGAFNSVNAALFRSPRVAQVAYPLLRAGRNATLRLLGRRRIG
jgi:predicted DCC family thiol-disulfide oxidoreductase YuxK